MTCSRMTFRAAAAWIALVVVLSAGAQFRADRDAIRISSPPSHRALAEGIVRTNASRTTTVATFVGYDGGAGPIEVVIAEESSPE